MAMGAISGVSKPRKPRNRALKRPVAPLGYIACPRGLYRFPLIERNRHRLITSLLPDAPLRMAGKGISPRNAEDLFIAALEDLAVSYRRWRRQQPGSKSEARYQLECLALLAAGFGGVDDAERQKLYAHIHPSNELARAALWAGLLRHPRWPSPDESPVDWLQSERINRVLVAEAAGDAAGRLQTRGDYADRNLTLATQLLVDIFADFTGLTPTMNKSRASPSAMCRLARAFFAIVSPGLSETTIDTGLNRLRSARNRSARYAQSFRPAFLTR